VRAPCARGGVALGVAVLLVLAAREGRAQFFSPGPLAKPHAALEGQGLDKCAKCHDQGAAHFAPRCLACHTELGPEIKQRDGLHGRMTEAARAECQSCHPDHRGREFSMISFGGSLKGFDHRQTGWALRGAHAAARCDGCHQARQLVDPGIKKMLAEQRGRTTYLGLSKRCDSCHFDEHRGQLGKECQTCHGEAALYWKAALGALDHQKTDFPLRGKHQKVACAACHPNVEDRGAFKQIFPPPRDVTFMKMKPIAHGSCESCHADPHKGSFGPNCASCHTEDGWNIILSARDLGPSFHERTRFPLRGAHATVGCKSCHGPFGRHAAVFRGLAFGKCADCHQDAHEAQLAPRGGGKARDCNACHDETAFSPPQYELEAHAKTSFPLEGGHRTTPCRDCHPIDKSLEARVPEWARTSLAKQHRPLVLSFAVLRPKIAAQTCSECHQDPHQGQLDAEIKRDDCRGCHTVRAWTDLTPFDHATDSRFPLDGAHRQAACASCHRVESIRAGAPAVVRWRPLPVACGGCHRDAHQGQFLAGTLPSDGAARPAEDCDVCHRTESFKQSQFRHDDARFTSYALKGKHATLPCADCHRTVALGAGDGRTLNVVRYRPLPRACEACHVDFHHGDFRGLEP
jgi:nitrate/TMAO reductase-like tetraheme cytochrome c subunit